MKVLVLLVFASLLFAGCVSAPEATPTPAASIPSISTPTPEASATPTPSPVPSVDENPLESLKNVVEVAMEGVLDSEVSFEADRDTASGLISFIATDSSNYFEYQVTVKNFGARMWPPDKSVTMMESENGVSKKIAFTESTSGTKVYTNAEVECGDFSHLVVMSFIETDSPVRPSQGLGLSIVEKVMDAC